MDSRKKLIAMSAALILGLAGTVSIAQAGSDSGDYKGGALYGPMPGQVFGRGQGQAAYSWFGYSGRGAYAYAGPRVRGRYMAPDENSAGHYRYHWEEY
jgi:hypothetical protein